MKVAVIFLILIAIVGITLYQTRNVHVAQYLEEIDQQTKTLCLEYALRDHEKEFAPLRWEKEKKMITEFDWYTSCLNHIKYGVR